MGVGEVWKGSKEVCHSQEWPREGSGELLVSVGLGPQSGGNSSMVKRMIKPTHACQHFVGRIREVLEVQKEHDSEDSTN